MHKCSKRIALATQTISEYTTETWSPATPPSKDQRLVRLPWNYVKDKDSSETSSMLVFAWQRERTQYNSLFIVSVCA